MNRFDPVHWAAGMAYLSPSEFKTLVTLATKVDGLLEVEISTGDLARASYQSEPTVRKILRELRLYIDMEELTGDMSSRVPRRIRLVPEDPNKRVAPPRRGRR